MVQIDLERVERVFNHQNTHIWRVDSCNESTFLMYTLAHYETNSSFDCGSS